MQAQISYTATYELQTSGEVRIGLSDSPCGTVFASVADFLDQWNRPLTDPDIQAMLLRLLLQQTLIDGLTPDKIDRKTITFTLASGQQPSIQIAPAP